MANIQSIFIIATFVCTFVSTSSAEESTVIGNNITTFESFNNGSYDDSELVPPHISVERYRSSEKWITIPINGSRYAFVQNGDDIKISDIGEVREILVSCRAPYPVQWTVEENVKVPQRIDGIQVEFSVTYLDPTAQDPKIQEFCSYLRIVNEIDFTGGYICAKTNDMQIQTTTYIFFEGLGFTNDTKKLLGSNDEFIVGINEKESIILPCRVTTKEVDVQLDKREENGNWIKVVTNATYDPKLGFSISKTDIDPLQGIYRCTAGSTEESIVTVVDTFNDDSTFPIKKLVDKQAAYTTRESGYGIQCCSNSTIYPNLLAMPCQNFPDCEIKKSSFMHLLAKVTTETSGVYPVARVISDSGACVETTGYSFVSPFIVQCKGDGIDVSGQYLSKFGPSFQKMEYDPFQDFQSDSYETNTSLKIVARRFQNVTDRDGDVSKEMVEFKLGEQPLYTGEEFFIDCCGLTFHHASGRILRIVWNDNTLTTLRDPNKDYFDDESEPYLRDFCYEYILWDTQEFITANENMTEFECVVPRWYNDNFLSKKVPLNIKVPKEPVFKFAEVIDEINYDENQLGLLILTCELEEGDPAPRYSWKKDGYPVNQSDQYWSDFSSTEGKGKANLLFMRAAQQIQGEYTCTAINMVGYSEKMFRVTVNPRSYADYLVALLIFGGFFLVIACFALRISYFEKPKKNKQVEPTRYKTHHAN